MRIVLLGPPGAGKGSLASLYHARLEVPHLSTGEIFRHEIARRSRLGRRVSRYVSNGRLVPDRLVVEVMASRLTGARANRFVLDGFPRTATQAAGLDRVLTRVTFVAAVYLVVIAIIPDVIMAWMKIPPRVASFFGGTSLLIVVGVTLDTMKQIESHLLMRHYEGFFKTGRLKSRR